MTAQDKQRKPTADELAGMQWWNSLSEAGRENSLMAAGWKPNGLDAPSAADAWAHHKKASISMPEP